jgi:hypothetical protein
MINDTQIKEKIEVKKCKLEKTKTEFLIKLIVVIIKILLLKGIKSTLTNQNLEDFIETDILNNKTVKEIINKTFVMLNDKLIEKTIISCMIVCKGSISNTQDHLKNIYNYRCCEGKISNIINKYSVKARKFNESINLSGIKVGANDEIFKASKPVLVGVEPKSNYIYLMELEEKRDGTTWWFHLEQKSQEQGLKLDKSINDAGKGLNKGIHDSFDNKCYILTDLFHCKHDFLKGLTSLENKAYGKIRVEYKLYKKYLKKENEKESYQKAVRSAKIAINRYDRCHEIYRLFNKCTEIGGYNYLERKENLNKVISELEKYNKYNTYIKKFQNFLKNNIEGLLRFVEDFYYRMNLIAIKEKVNPEIFKLMWKQNVFDKYSEEYNIREIEILNVAKKDYSKIRNLFNDLIANTIRASSIVENINSLLRPYLDIKKSPNQNFLDLLQLYFNTRKFKRSNIDSKKGYSPLELYTKKEQFDFFEILGF